MVSYTYLDISTNDFDYLSSANKVVDVQEEEEEDEEANEEDGEEDGEEEEEDGEEEEEEEGSDEVIVAEDDDNTSDAMDQDEVEVVEVEVEKAAKSSKSSMSSSKSLSKSSSKSSSKYVPKFHGVVLFFLTNVASVSCLRRLFIWKTWIQLLRTLDLSFIQYYLFINWYSLPVLSKCGVYDRGLVDNRLRTTYKGLPKLPG